MSLRRTTSALTIAAALAIAGCSSTTTTEAGTPTSAGAPSTTGAQPLASYTLPASAMFPEGITNEGDTFYVTATADGSIYTGTTGTAAMTQFAPGGVDGRTTAIGLDVAKNRLVVAGGATGNVWIFDTATGALTGRFSNNLGQDATFLNDVAIAANGDAYVTDSRSPTLWRIPADQVSGTEAGTTPLTPFVDFTGSPLVYGSGFNANGIVTTADASAVVVVQSGTGLLYRVDTASKAVTPVDLGGLTLVNGDGMQRDGNTLYVVRNRDGVIVRITLAADGSSGTAAGEIRDPSLMYPTTTTSIGDRLLVVNSQFDKRGGGATPVTPFTVSSISAG